MEPIAMRLLIEKESDEFNLKVPAWIGARMGDLLLMQYDGERLIISPIINK